jgi:hypothetical protein
LDGDFTGFPRFCPRCDRDAEPPESLCVQCGEGLVEQGFCPTCEHYWRRPAGTPCPKHEVDLEEAPPAGAGGRPGDPATHWVTVGTFAHTLSAEAPRIRLEAEGIPTFLEGERMGSQSMYHVATGGVKLQVPKGLEADARVLLSQTWSTPASGEDDDLDDAWDDLAPDPGAVSLSLMKVVVRAFILGAALVALATTFIILLH